MYASQFIKAPVKGQKVKVYYGTTNETRFGIVTGIKTVEVNEKDEDSGQVIRSREVAVLDPTWDVPFNQIDYFLPHRKVQFKIHSN